MQARALRQAARRSRIEKLAPTGCRNQRVEARRSEVAPSRCPRRPGVHRPRAVLAAGECECDGAHPAIGSPGHWLLHPGWVKTDMGGSKAKLEIEESVGSMLKVINAFDISKTGTFVNYDGKKLEW